MATINRILLWIKTHKETTLLFLIIILAVILRAYNLGMESIWLDEAHSYRIALLDIESIIQKMTTSNQSPLYFVLLHYWVIIFGTTESALRAMSLVFGVASIVVIYQLGCLLYNKRVGLIGSFLSAISWFHIYYSQEARPYTLLMFLSLLSFLFFIKILNNEGKTTRQLLLYLIVNVCICVTHFLGVLVIISQAFFLFIFWSKYSSTRFRLHIAQLLTGASLLPFALLKQSTTTIIIQEGFWVKEPTFDSITTTLQKFSGNNLLVFYLFCLLVLFALFSVSKLDGYWRKKDPLASLSEISWKFRLDTIDVFILLVLWLLIPITLLFLISKALVPLYVDRYIIGASPALIILASKGLDKIIHYKIYYLFIIVIVIISGSTLIHYYSVPNKSEWREVGDYIESNELVDDIALFCPGYNQNPFDYYYNGTVPIVRVGKALEDDFEIEEVLYPVMTDKKRAWLVRAQVSSRSPTALEDYLTKKYGNENIVLERNFHGVRVVLYNLE